MLDFEREVQSGVFQGKVGDEGLYEGLLGSGLLTALQELNQVNASRQSLAEAGASQYVWGMSRSWKKVAKV